MTQAKELDIGPLAWVSGEIEQALERAAEAIAQVAADPEQHTQLQFARTHLHQARGALSIVGLDGACQFADTLDALLSACRRAACRLMPPTPVWPAAPAQPSATI